tara:strand:- start:488 stop:643 length:156 start_codon:yes stop_codon:yes gene_type:complete
MSNKGIEALDRIIAYKELLESSNKTKTTYIWVLAIWSMVYNLAIIAYFTLK